MEIELNTPKEEILRLFREARDNPNQTVNLKTKEGYIYITGGILSMLKGSELYRIVLDENDRYVHSEVLIKQLARIRDIETGPDGNIYLLLEHADGGQIVRLVPAKK